MNEHKPKSSLIELSKNLLNQVPLPWQVREWQLLINNWQNNHLAHAFLLKGRTGIGKRLFALGFAKFLLCENKLASKALAVEIPKNLIQPNLIACEQCDSCQLFSIGNHPDCLTVTPEEEGKNIKIDQIRSLIESLNRTAHRSSYKVVIIDPCDALNLAATNALLKSLEEPNPGVVFFLLSSQAKLLPATLRSRCQQIPFSSIRESIAIDWLSTQLPYTREQCIQLLILTHYSPLQALAWHENPEIIGQRQLFFKNLWELTYQKYEPTNIALYWHTYKLLLLIDWWLSLLFDLVQITLVNQPERIINKEWLTQLQDFRNTINLQKLFKFLDQLLQVSSWLKDKVSLNSQTLLEGLFIQWQSNFS